MHKRPKKKKKTQSRRVLICHPSEQARRVLIEGMKILGHNPILASGMSKVLEAVRSKEVDALLCDLEQLSSDDATSCFLRSTLLVSPELRFVAVARERGLDEAVEAIHHGARKVIYLPYSDGKEVAKDLKSYLGDASSE
jgi:DNA-binding NtrC family response regulator